MTLSDYLTKNGLSLKRFAALAGLSAPTVLRARDGLVMPSTNTVRAILTATGGTVTISDLIRVPNETKDQPE